MKRKAVFLLLVACLLSGCNVISPPTPTALPTIVLGNAGISPSQTGLPAAPEGVTASGVVAPAREAQIAYSLGGSIQVVNVTEGSRVEEGRLLARLSGSEKLAAALEAANLEFLAAQQALTDLQGNAEQARAQAQLRLAQARDALDKAEKRRSGKAYRVGSDNQIAVAQADLFVAEDAVKKAEEVYNGYAGSAEDNLNKAAALSALAAARTARDKAQANLNYLLSIPNTIEVEKADAELAVARAEMAAAQLEYDTLKNGPDPEALALAEARIQNAKAQQAAAQAALTDLELKAPFAGTVSKLNIVRGEWVLPGQPVLVLADLDHLQIETTDLSERDVPGVKIGQPVSVFIKALDQEVTGRVSEISPLADTLGGDVVYATRIELDTQPAALRAGMSVEVQFGANP